MGTKQFWHFMRWPCAAFAAAAMLASSAGAANNYAVLFNFSNGNDGGRPQSDLTFDAAGNAYGVTATGGTLGFGTIFKLKPTGHGQWQESVLWNFDGSLGKNPYGGVTLDRAGNIFGTTVAGGFGGICTGDGCGMAYELTKAGLNPIYSFKGGNDGFGPGNALAADRRGNLFGTTPDGGRFKKGTVYELTFGHGQWHEKIIHHFTGGADGAVGSLGRLLVDSAGRIFGVTELGGANSAGTAYEVTPAAGGTWKFTTLYAFKNNGDGAFPYGGLTPNNGALYGTTYYGGTHGVGTVYVLTNAIGGWKEHVLYSFKGGTDGSLTTTTPIFDAAGNLYGTTSAGGITGCDCGTVFKLAAGTWKESIVHRFGAGVDGNAPYAGFTTDGHGNLFSSTNFGGINGQGTVFRYTP